MEGKTAVRFSLRFWFNVNDGKRADVMKLKQLIEAESVRDMLYKYLRDYQQNHEISTFVDSLQSVVSHPNRLVLFDEVRPFIQPSQQTLYNQLIPPMPSKKMRSIRFVRQGSENLGFALRGGLEFDVGVFVCEVTPKSWAAHKGLKVGDEIVRVNGYNISQATHSEVISALTMNKTITLKIRSYGMIPVKTEITHPVTWKLVNKHQGSFQVESENSHDSGMETDRKVFVNLQTGKKLGCGIGTGQNNEPGIFVLNISQGSLAEKMNFKVGDQILDVNGTSFLNISHDAAVMELKSSSQLTITLRSKKVMDGDILPLDKSRNLLVGAEVSPIPKKPPVNSPETVKNQSSWEDKTSEEKNLKNERIDKEDDVDMGKSSLSSNWSFESKQKSEKYNYPHFEQTVAKETMDHSQAISKSKQLEPSESQAWWNKDPYSLFTLRQIDGRKLCKVEVIKDKPLQMLIEGGIGSPLAGRVVISEIYADGAADRSGGLLKGDQLMRVDGKNMIDISLNSAQDILKEAMSNTDGTEVLRIITAVSPLKNSDDEVTFF